MTALRPRSALLAAALASLAAGGAAAAMPGPAGAPMPGSGTVAGGPLHEPRVIASRHGVLRTTLVAADRRVDVAGQQLEAKVYDCSFVGPTLAAHPGDEVRITLVNRLREATNLHFHGLHVSPRGSADNVFISVAPGHRFTYAFRIPRDHPTGTFWYHSHADMTSEEQVFDGLSGVLEIEGLRDLLPKGLRHVRERTLALRDLQVLDGRIVDSGIDSDAPTERTVDGQLRPRIDLAPGETQLWHLANVGADIFYDVALAGHAFRVIAQDGHPVTTAWTSGDLVMPPGKRFDVLVRGGRPGTALLRTLRYGQGDDVYPERTLATVRTAGPRRRAQPFPHRVSWPADLSRARIASRRTVVFSESADGRRFFIDGRMYARRRVDLRAKLNTVEEWTIRNTSDEQHPFHVHTYPFQVTAVDGVPATFAGYQDEVILPPEGEATIRIPFTGFTGVTVFHCHILAHEDAGMMANLDVER